MTDGARCSLRVPRRACAALLRCTELYVSVVRANAAVHHARPGAGTAGLALAGAWGVALGLVGSWVTDGDADAAGLALTAGVCVVVWDAARRPLFPCVQGDVARTLAYSRWCHARPLWLRGRPLGCGEKAGPPLCPSHPHAHHAHHVHTPPGRYPFPTPRGRRAYTRTRFRT